MQLSPDAIQEFRALYAAQFGVDLSESDAVAVARSIAALVALVYDLD